MDDIKGAQFLWGRECWWDLGRVICKLYVLFILISGYLCQEYSVFKNYSLNIISPNKHPTARTKQQIMPFLHINVSALIWCTLGVGYNSILVSEYPPEGCFAAFKLGEWLFVIVPST